MFARLATAFMSLPRGIWFEGIRRSYPGILTAVSVSWLFPPRRHRGGHDDESILGNRIHVAHHDLAHGEAAVEQLVEVIGFSR